MKRLMNLKHPKTSLFIVALGIFVYFKYWNLETLERMGFGAGNSNYIGYGITTKYTNEFLSTYLDTLILKKNLDIPVKWLGARRGIEPIDSSSEKVLYQKENLEIYYFELMGDGFRLLAVFKDGDWIGSKKYFKEAELLRIADDINNKLLIGLDSIGKAHNVPDSVMYNKQFNKK